MKIKYMFLIIFLFNYSGYSVHVPNNDKEDFGRTKKIDLDINMEKLIEIYRKKDFEYDLMNDRVAMTNLVDRFMKKNAHFFESQEEGTFALTKEFYKVVLVCTLAMIAYGIVNNQITARMCIEYFNSDAIADHKHYLNTYFPFISQNSPTAVGLASGIGATWWRGLLMGTSVGGAALIGTAPKLKLRTLSTHLPLLFGIMGILSLLAGLVGYIVGELSIGAVLSHDRIKYVPENKYGLFAGVFFADTAASLTATFGSIFLVMWVLFKRGVFTNTISYNDQQEIGHFFADLQQALSTEPTQRINDKIKRFMNEFKG